MVLAHKDDHPYWYAQILGVFHVNVIYTGKDTRWTKQMDFLWVRWFGRDPNNYRSGWNVKCLHRLGFIPADEPGSFGFLDPRQIVRGIHLIPTFAYSRTDKLLPPSISHPLHEKNEDWKFYYVNMFVDRDMFMRFRGGGVGHKSTCNATQIFRNDCDPLDCVAPGNNADSEQDEEAFEGDEEASEGDEEGASEGDEEGAAEGDEEGATEGDEGGPSEGDEEGATEGDEGGPSEGDEGIIDQDEDEVGESEMEEFGYGGLDQEEDDTDSDENDSDSNNEDNDIDNDLGPEDGEDENEEALEGYAEL
ncbi:hypothetical protein DEU56DRAFT_729383 [Suillus clintonianus]|uniref:uncharacterized protein n=1 Tax=Suillus clintonianus TaxID=1904413 RepID=UPI001B8759D6|nr:uncharacterized protein DEU56DRAFT_729383 [Suillus clintonianus]KAG2149214.1 hypothetical protein DEU56DRAFT_729383 [Suillus clintonianus]